MNPLELIDLKARPELWALVNNAPNVAWPEFMMHDQVAARHWGNYLRRFPQYSFALLSGGALAASANAIPLPWDGDTQSLPAGWDAALESGMGAADSPDRSGFALCALGVTTQPDFQGKGCGKQLLLAMKERARSEGFPALITPMRPTHKHHHPALPMADYLRRKNPQGKAEDPWLRTHLSLGAKVLKVAQESMRIEGTLKEWSDWTKMTFGKSGNVEVPGALALVKIDLAANKGVYVEPNVWLQYQL